MILQRLQLYSFRNYAAQSVDFGPAANFVMGPNGQGKTNLLEAITLLSSTKSFRTSRDSEMIAWEQPECRVWGETLRTARPDADLEVRMSREEGKKIFINKTPHPRVVDLIGQLNLVTFWVEDIEIARGDPSQRRRFLNAEISQISPQYCYQLAGYRRVIEQRNRLLKQIAARGSSNGSLSVWNRQLVSYGAPIMDRRREFLKRLQEPAAEAHANLTDGKEKLELIYEPSFVMEGITEERFEGQLADNQAEEIRRGVTLFGPHRDDLLFLLNGRDARVYGSLGQQRSVTLSLRIAELKLMLESIGEEPVVVMDDIFAELDRFRTTRLLEMVLPNRQSILATTEETRLPLAETFADIRRFSVRAGVVTPVEGEEGSE
jgi:DNA replication and repair protein RecF